MIVMEISCSVTNYIHPPNYILVIYVNKRFYFYFFKCVF